jgi:hypothetical protein
MIATGAEGQANMTTSDQNWHEFDEEGDWLNDEEEPSAGRRRKRHRGGTEEDEILDEEDEEDEAQW